MNLWHKINLSYILSISVAVLFFFWPVPNVSAVRYLMLFLSIVASLVLLKKMKLMAVGDYRIKIFTVLVFVIVGWIYFVGIFVSKETAWSLKESNVWIFSTLSFCLGLFVAAIHTHKSAFFIIAGAIAIHVIYIDLSAIRSFVEDGTIPLRVYGMTKGPHDANYLTNFAFAILLTEIFSRKVSGVKIIPVDNFILSALVVLTFASSYFEAMRFGFVGIIVMLVSVFLLWLLMQERLHAAKIVVFAIVVFSLMITTATISYKNDQRWNSLVETIPIALDTTTYKAWLNWDKYPIPKLANGDEVGHSNYIRVARAKEGLIAIYENPFGVGYGRHAFGHAMQAKYGEGNGFTESGIIDLGIGIGFPGMILWIVFVSSLAAYGVKSFYNQRSYYGLVLFFIAGGYFFRMMVDSVIKDHMLEQFMFLAGLFLALSIKEQNEKNSASEV